MKREISESRQAVDVMRVITEKGESYPKEIAEELDKSPSAISNTIAKLREEGIINRGKRTQAQYYRVSHERLADIWRKEISKALEEEYTGQENPPLMEEWNDNEEESERLALKYFRSVFAWDMEGNPTLGQIMFDIFLHLLGSYITGETDDEMIPNYLHSIYFGCKLKSDLIFNYDQFTRIIDGHIHSKSEVSSDKMDLTTPSIWNESDFSYKQVYEEEGKSQEEIFENNREKFEHIFKKNLDSEGVPKHPYKIYRNIIKSKEDLSDEEKITLEILKNKYSRKWQELKDEMRGF